MPLYGIDISNHQGAFDFAAAKREGFDFATHKITEGSGYRDPYWARARAEMAKHFPDRWGGYVFCKVGTDPTAEARTLREHAGTPDFPLQIDYEDLDRNGSLADLNRRIDAYRAAGFTNLLPIYIPRWYWRDRMGSPDLSRLPVPIWNSHYVNGTGYASNLYPGDDHSGWAPVGGKDVAILQFSEQAAVAGQRIDVNAFRGNETQLAALFGAGTEKELDMAGEAQDVQQQLRGPDLNGWPQLGNKTLVDATADVRDQLGGPDHNFGGWPQLGDRTIVDALAVIGETLKIPGFKAPTKGK